MNNIPEGRKKRVTGVGKGVHKKGAGLGTGPVGSGMHQMNSHGPIPDGPHRGGRRRSPLSFLLILIVVALFGGTSMFGGLGGDSGSGGSGSNSGSPSNTINSYYTNDISQSSGWNLTSNTGKLDRSIADGSRAKYTGIMGNGNDTVTIMLYMCGTDLESRSGMATSDLVEMANAKLSDKINLIVYTGGCARWKNQVVSNRVNQIYQVKNGGLIPLKQDDGSAAMTNPATLASFIQFCKKNFPANRNELILWDHGGGSVSGYGYDEKNRSAGSMTLQGIKTALTKGGMKFDFIGFDACLMATVENGLMLDEFADYLIASEETEPGIGWYYTDWLNVLSQNTSMPTLEIGQKIVDTFVEQCNAKCRGQATTLSVVDLAELSNTIPPRFRTFSSSTSELIENNKYKQVSDARYQTREFAQATKIDQVDLTHFAYNVGTKEGEDLAKAILSAVKYNRTSSSINNAYGLSIYFPLRRTSNVDSAVKTYEGIGLDEEYSRCIQSFAKMEVSGQAVSGGQSSPYPSLSGSGSSNMDPQAMIQILSGLLGGDLSGLTQSITGLDSSNIGFLTGRSISDERVSDYVTSHQLDVSHLIWTEENGKRVLKLSKEEWDSIHDLVLNMFYDDGEGYVNLGLDNVYEFDNNNNLVGETDRSWVSIDDTPVAYYFESMTKNGDDTIIRGYVPALLNGTRVNLNILFDNSHPDGYIDGAMVVYEDEETETVGKNLVSLEKGDTIQFICDYYSYSGEYVDSYELGDPIRYTDDLTISNTIIPDGDVRCSYCLTDIYNQTYWTPGFN